MTHAGGRDVEITGLLGQPVLLSRTQFHAVFATRFQRMKFFFTPFDREVQKHLVIATSS